MRGSGEFRRAVGNLNKTWQLAVPFVATRPVGHSSDRSLLIYTLERLPVDGEGVVSHGTESLVHDDTPAVVAVIYDCTFQGHVASTRVVCTEDTATYPTTSLSRVVKNPAFIAHLILPNIHHPYGVAGLPWIDSQNCVYIRVIILLVCP